MKDPFVTLRTMKDPFVTLRTMKDPFIHRAGSGQGQPSRPARSSKSVACRSAVTSSGRSAS